MVAVGGLATGGHALAAGPAAGLAESVSAAAAAGAPGAKAPKPSLRVLTRTRARLRRGRMRVKIAYPVAGRVRVTARFRRPGRRRLARFTRQRRLRFRGPARRTLRLRLTGGGRSVVRKRGCALKVGVVVRGIPRRPLRSRRVRRTFKLRRAPGARCTLPGAPNPVPAAPFRAGAASADLTPPIGTPMFAYTARSGVANPESGLQIIGDPDENLYAKSFVPSEGIHTRVRARALVFEQRGRKFALVQADLGGLPYALTQEVSERVAVLGISGDRLLLAATHTHASTGPIWPADSQGYAALGGDAFDPRVFELTVQGVVEAIRTAHANLEPAELGVATTELRGASRNRAFDAFRRNPDAPSAEADARRASVNPDLTVIRVDAPDGRPIAVWSNFAIHPTSFGDENLLFSGDNVGTAERVAERAIAADATAAGHPPAPDRPPVNVWTNSSEGDISPQGDSTKDGTDALEYVPNKFASANLAGKRVGDGIHRAWRTAGRSMDRSVALDARRTFVAFDGTPAAGEPVGPLTVLGAGGIVMDDGFCAPSDNFAGPGQGRKFPALAGTGLVPLVSPVSMWRVGDLGILGLPSEVTKQMGLRITSSLVDRSRGALDRVSMAGLANGYVSYTSTPQEYDFCGYEGSFTLFGRRQGPRWLDVASDALAALLGGVGASGDPEPPQPALGTPNTAAVEETPAAGQVVSQPAAQVRRHDRARFSWRGGDPAVDAPRGGVLVALQRLDGGQWKTVATDDSESDTTALGDDGVWTETWQFGTCDQLASYRFHVTGVADKGAGPAPYEVTSAAFELLPTPPLAPGPLDVSSSEASLTATYADPGKDILLALPRRVRTGAATLTVNGAQVQAPIDGERLRFRAAVPPGASVTVAGVDDGCGNRGP